MIARDIAVLGRHEVRLAVRSWLSDPRGGRGLPPILGWIVLGALWAFLSFLGGQGLLLAGSVASPLALAAISAALLLLAAIMLAQAISAAVEGLYVRADLDFLLCAPIAPASVLAVRMGAVALRVGVFWLSLSFGAALVAAFGGDWRWAGLPAATLGLSLLVVGVGLWVAQGLFALLGARRARTVGQVLSGVIGASIALGAQAWSLSRRGEGLEAWQARLEAFTAALPQLASPLWLPAKAFAADPLALAAWVALTSLIFGLSVASFGRRFLAHSAAALALPKKTRERGASGPFVGGLLAAAARKELRLLTRNPLLISALLLPFLYLLLPFGVVLLSVLRGETGGGATVGAVGATLIVWIAVIAARGAAGLTLLTEEAPDLAAAAPVPAQLLRRAKLLAALAPVGAVVALALLPVGVLSVQAAMVGVLGAAGAGYSAALVAVRRGQPRPKRELRAGVTAPKMPIGATLAGGFATASFVSATGLATTPAWALAIIPALIGLGLTLALVEEG